MTKQQQWFNAGQWLRMYFFAGIFWAFVICPLQATEKTALSVPLQARRILFLGDSITHAGGYIDLIEAQFRLQGLDPLPELLNVGLSSETCSGLSEPDHPFPRPNVQDRLVKALELTKPDLVVACYGMNDGIYHPFAEERFQAYQAGVNLLIERVHNSGAKLILLTPPPFDPLPGRMKGKLVPAGADQYAYFAVYEDYDNVIKRYGQWIMQQKDQVEMVIDLHQPITNYVTEQRKQNPEFTIAPDGVHPNAFGHEIIAKTILAAWGVPAYQEPPADFVKLIRQRETLLHDAWLTHIGHNRPNTKPGPPLNEAEAKAAELLSQIEKAAAELRKPVTQLDELSDGRLVSVYYPATLKPGHLKLRSEFRLWLPNTPGKLKSVIVHQHGCGTGASNGGKTAAFDLHWQELARVTNSALLGTSYEANDNVDCRLWCDPRHGSADIFLQAITDMAEISGHDELDDVHWTLWGHSGGGFWASLMQTMYPERIIAIWLQSGTAYSTWKAGEIPEPVLTEAVFQVPVMGNPGVKEKEHPRFSRAWSGTVQMQTDYKKAGAPFFEFAPDPRTGHECGDSRYLSIPFFRFWIEQRVAENPADPLIPVSAKSLADWDQQLAGSLAEFIETGAVSDITPPDHPLAVKVSKTETGYLFNWLCRADFESGIQSFVFEQNGKKIAQHPEKPVGRYGRSLFQAMSYHDTPEAPLPEMQLEIPFSQVQPGPITIRTVNSVGLKSTPLPVQIP